jgi:hypothetical protein
MLYLLKECWRDQQLLQYFDMNVCDNEEKHYSQKIWIFHIATSPCVLLIDQFNLIVFNQQI